MGRAARARVLHDNDERIRIHAAKYPVSGYFRVRGTSPGKTYPESTDSYRWTA